MAEGKLGFKSGEGFRKWTPEQQAALRAKVLQHLKKARDERRLNAWRRRRMKDNATSHRTAARS